MRLLKILAAVYFLLVFAIPFLVLYPFFLICLSTPRLYPWANRLRKFWAWLIVLLAFIRPKITKDAPFDTRKACVLVANHSSYLDIIGIGLIAGPRFAFMAKAELGKIPLFGIFFKTVDIAVERKSITASHKAFLTAAERLRKGDTIMLFPEGTIGDQVPALGRFKPGAFRLAIDNGVPIVPVTFSDNWRLLPDGTIAYHPGRMRIHIHRAIEVSHLKPEDADGLSQRVFSIIESKLREEGVLPSAIKANTV